MEDREIEVVVTNDDGTTSYCYEGGLRLTLRSEEELERLERQRAADRPAWIGFEREHERNRRESHEFMSRIGMGGYHIYRMFAQNGTLLYIGMSGNPKARMKAHFSTTEWVREFVHRVEVSDPYPTQLEAYKAEREAIIAEKPLHNKAGRGTRAPNGKES